MPVTSAYNINYLSTLFPDVYQAVAALSVSRQTHLTFYSFGFNGPYKGTPAGNSMAGECLLPKGFA